MTERDGPRVRVGGLERAPGEPALIVGRELGVDVEIDSPLVSRQHGRVEWSSDGWRYRDTGSRNGTFLDGERVTDVPLTERLELHLGAADGPALAIEVIPAPVATPSSGPGRHPSEDRPTALGHLTAIHAARGGTLRIGRDPGNDLVVDDLRVSRNHAALHAQPGGPSELEDLGSANGTFVNGQRITRVRLADGDVVGIGGSTFRFAGGALEEYTEPGGAWLAAVGLGVEVGSKRLLEDVSFALQPSSLLAVVGPSGAGKTTLLNALTGFRPADRGYVLFGGRNLYEAYGELRQRMGFVPQSDILHTQLTVRQALSYAAELRFPPDVGRAAREARVVEVIAELGLTQRADVVIGRLSGGQRKRVSVAVELLTRPSLLFLDEPTSGLDPANEANLMELLRDLAAGGRTILVVTHSVQSLALCDRVLFLAPGGRLAFFGEPAEVEPFFGRQGVRSGTDQVFRALAENETVDWRAAFESDALHERHVRRPLGDAGPAGPIAMPVPEPPRPSTPRLRQLWVLVRRHLAVLRSDRGVLALLALQAPIFGLLYLLLFRQNVFSTLYAIEAAVLAWLLAIGATWLGTSNAIREIVKELPIYRRERSIGLSTSAYVASKVLILGSITALQTIVMVAIAIGLGPHELPPTHPADYEAVVADLRLAGVDAPTPEFDDRGAFLADPFTEIVLGATLTGVAAMAVGLLLSAVLRTTDRASSALPLLLIVQTVVSAPLLGTPGAGLREVGYVSTAQWGLAAMASTIDLNDVRGPFIAIQDTVRGRDPTARGRRASWEHDADAWRTNIAILAAMTVLATVGAWYAMRRLDPDLESRRAPAGFGRRRSRPASGPA